MVKALRYLFVLFVIAMIALGSWVLPSIKFNSDVMALFPRNGHAPDITRANDLFSQGFSEKVFFLLSSNDWQSTKAAVPSFVATLRACECFHTVSARQDARAFQALRALYIEHAPVILSRKDRILLEKGQGEALATAALRDFMVNPADVPSATLARDPLGTVEEFINARQTKVAGRGAIDEGYLYFMDDSADRRHVLVTAELADSPFSLATQAAAHKAIAAAEIRFQRSVPDGQVIRTGTFFSARAGSEQALFEISTVGLGSALGVILILLLVFRSLTSLVVAFLPIVAGISVGLIVTALAFGSVHIISLVFGAILVGVSIDYAFYFLCKRQGLGADWQPELGLRKLMSGLTLALMTSIAGYLGFTAAGFPGLQQVAVFSCAGLVAAYMVVIGFYPWVLQGSDRVAAPRVLQRGIPRYLDKARAVLSHLKYPEFFVPLALLAAAGVWKLPMQDDIRALQMPSPGLQQDEQQFRELVGSVTALPYVLVKADTPEALLQELEQLRAPLTIAATEALGGFTLLSNWLPSQKSQEHFNTLLRTQVVETNLLQDYLNTLGVDAEAQAELLTAFDQPAEDFLTLDEATPAIESLLQRPLHFSAGNTYYSFVLLEGLKKSAPLKELVEENENVVWVDQAARTSRFLEEYRVGASWVAAAAYLLIFLILAARYRLKGALLIIVPPLLGSLFALATLGWLGLGLSVFNVMALLLILGIGTDYSLFLRESGGQGYDTVLAIALSGLTTLLSVGLLSFSATHAIFSFGLTALLGLSMSLLLAPLSLPPLPPRRSGKLWRRYRGSH
jgi:predicted exporter